MLIQILLALILNAPPAGSGAMAPNLYSNGNQAWLTWIEPVDEDKHIYALRMASLLDGAWGESQTITKGSNLFVNWADFPELCVANDGSMFATWLQKSGAGAYSYDIGIARSDDEGRSWSMMGTLNDDRVLGEHGFVSLVPEGEQGVRAFWLDGREISGDGHSGEGGGDMQLRTTSIDTEVHPSELMDERACECCGTDATVFDGHPLVVYRDRDDLEVRDISIATLGYPSTSINDDQWRIEGCPVNGPSIDSNETDVVVAWFTSPELGSKANIAFISAQGIDDPILISNKTLGRVDVVMQGEGTAVACWLETCSTGTFVVTSKVSKDGTVEPFKQIQKVASSHQAGFPRIATVGDDLLIVWTAEDTEQGIQTALIEPDIPELSKP